MYHVVLLLQKTHLVVVSIGNFLGKTFFVNPVPVALIEEGRSDSDDVGVGMSVADYVQPEVGSSGTDDVKAEVDTSDDERVLPCALQSTQPNETERDKRKPYP